MKRLFTLVITLSLLLLLHGAIYAEDCDASNLSSLNLDELARRKEKCESAWSSMQAAKQPHVDALKKMEADIAAFQARLVDLEASVAKKSKAIAEGEKEMSDALERVSARLRRFYIREAFDNPLALFFTTDDIGTLMRLLTYQQVVVNGDKKEIAQTASMVAEFERKKKDLVSQKASVAAMKSDTNQRAEAVRKLVADAQAYQDKLSGIIASLTAQQQAILNAKSGTFTTSVGDVPLSDDPNASPNYNPGFSPAFGGFSFGAYTHRKGMSQYGAKGRADRGQSAADILRAYYGKTPEGKDTGGNISVSGFGSMEFETTYLYGIAEMPSNFPMEALKAQAIAARSYAYRAKQAGQTICTTQSCQVFLMSKSNTVRGDSGNPWRKAVDETRGQVITDIVTYYSSTTGGYSTTSGWDTICGNQGCWTGDAYEKIAGSPWFYKGWYTADYSNSSAKCGRNHPWLTQEEFADIINAWSVRKNGGGDSGRVLPITINSCSISGASGNPYSLDELRNLGGYTSVSAVSVSYNSGGYTDTVIVQTNKGEVRINGKEFKDAFNLRAPGYISLKSPLFNIEKK